MTIRPQAMRTVPGRLRRAGAQRRTRRSAAPARRRAAAAARCSGGTPAMPRAPCRRRRCRRADVLRGLVPALGGQRRNGDPNGLFTGYYEPEVRGARSPGGIYRTPLLGRPHRPGAGGPRRLRRPTCRAVAIVGRVQQRQPGAVLGPRRHRGRRARPPAPRHASGWPTRSTPSSCRSRAPAACGCRTGGWCGSPMPDRTAGRTCRSAACWPTAAQMPLDQVSHAVHPRLAGGPSGRGARRDGPEPVLRVLPRTHRHAGRRRARPARWARR